MVVVLEFRNAMSSSSPSPSLSLSLSPPPLLSPRETRTRPAIAATFLHSRYSLIWPVCTGPYLHKTCTRERIHMVECAAGRGARGREGEYEGVGELALSSWGARVIRGCHAALRETSRRDEDVAHAIIAVSRCRPSDMPFSSPRRAITGSH